MHHHSLAAPEVFVPAAVRGGALADAAWFDAGLDPEDRAIGQAVILEFRLDRAVRPAPAETIPQPIDKSLRAALDDLYRHHNDALISFLRARLRSDADAREAAQDAYVRLLQLCESQRPLFLKAYLFKIAANVATDMLRRKRRRSPDAVSPAEQRQEATQERTLVARQQLEAILAALQELSPPCRQAFVLSRQHGCSTPTIAEKLGISDRTARRYLIKALDHLHDALSGAPDWTYHCG